MIDPRLFKSLTPVLRAASELETRVYAVGGCVRDALAGAPPTTDVDLVLESDPVLLARRAGGSFTEFGRFGTVRLTLPGGARFDLARARSESYPSPGALPVVRPATLAEDLRRRDFSVNAMAAEIFPARGALIDPFGGREDLKKRRLRVLHDASFIDDPTRLYRGARYAARFGLRPEPDTARNLRQACEAGLAGKLSRERLRQELMRTLAERDPAGAMRLLGSWDLLRYFHSAFRYPAKAKALASPEERLGFCALAMGTAAGAELLASLPLARETGTLLSSVLKAAADKETPARELAPQARRLLAAFFPRLPKTAFGPRLLAGADLKKLDIPPGAGWAELLARAARAQWRGEFVTRSGALAWLKKISL